MADEPVIEVARYQFHSWSRKGISSRITEPDDLGEKTSTFTERVKVQIPVKLNGAGHSKDFELIGPGDIIGVNRDMIVRTEPRDWITDAEPNYLAFLEFYDEEFAWRYTPAAPVFSHVPEVEVYKPSKLRPWLFLLVVKEDEFEKTKRRTPLTSIKLKVGDVFPPANETWLWAHVHSNADIPDADQTHQEKFLESLNKTIDDDPDQLYCRLMSPRKLEPNSAYCAFLVPSFETGRLAGLGESTETVNAQLASWTDDNAAREFPVYYEWSFRTGLNADFESLVTALKPVDLDERVGIRDMDCTQPGFVRANSLDDFPGTIPGIIGLEGAVKSPFMVSTVFPPASDSGEFPKELEDLINLPIEIKGTNESGDPIISIPFYGNKHAKKSITDVKEFDFQNNTWLHDMNRDPRTRVAAGLGTLVIQKNQENYMQKAWQQVTNIIKANRMITLTQFHMYVAFGFERKTFVNFPQNMLLAISKPVLSRVMGSPTTVQQQIKDSQLPLAVFSGAFRRLARPRNLKKISPDAPFDLSRMLNHLNEGTLSAAPTLGVPTATPTMQDFADQIIASAKHPPAWLQWIMKHRILLLIILLIGFAALAFLTAFYIPFAILAVASVGGYLYINKLNNDVTAKMDKDNMIVGILTDPQKDLENIAIIPANPKFTLKLSDERESPPPTLTSPTTDSVEAKKFRSALTKLTKRFVVHAPEKKILPLDIPNAYKKISEAIKPGKSFSKRLSGMVTFPGNIQIKNEPEKIFPAMAYPDFEDPMYKKLTDISDELLLPNLKLVPPNCISLLETNPKFIESYLVGLNHEMGRELLWREYPTDERGSYFRQFWDVKGIVKPADSGSAQENKDIVPIDTWFTNSDLGKHNGRTTAGDNPEKLVLVIRGDLLKKYPDSVIFAQKAIAGVGSDHLPRIIPALTDEEFKTHVKFPLFKAKIAPDIRFFGFDMTIEQARGTKKSSDFAGDTLGWFFCIAQAPGEARFGMDINFTVGDNPITWDNLAWTNFDEDADIRFITKDVVPNVPGLGNSDKRRWAKDAATMADILFQKPGMVAVHANDMLKGLTKPTI